MRQLYPVNTELITTSSQYSSQVSTRYAMSLSNDTATMYPDIN